ncbi:MAG: phospholipid carrier-dependent glycosyltransferase [Lachnospiraceae bacterium]|nr:phospholipid carrier-dependent glycosyltransferase [Lachnospiraceae bacterium]
MLFIHFSAILGTLVFVICFWGAKQRRGTFRNRQLFLLFLGALFLRLIAAALSRGFGNDTACFASWANRIFEVGPGHFYSPDVFTDYPPGYMYVLWIVGAIGKLFHMQYYSVPHLILLKLPAIICDIFCGLLLFKEASKKCSQNQALFLCAAYLFNPAIILNSSVWGQVDSVYTLAILYMCLCLIHRKTYSTYIAFAIGVLIKPQTLMFAPVLLAGIIEQVFLQNFSVKKFLHHLFQGLTAIGGMVILCLPFGLENVWKQYFTTVSSYPYAAVNACNFWGLFGLNWISQDNLFLGLPCRIWGWSAIVIAIAVTLLLGLRNRKDSEKYPFLGAFLMLTIFVFSVRMHERYLYPALILLLFAYIYKPAKMNFLCYAGFSIMHFYNTADILFFYDPKNYDRKSPLIILVSLGMLVSAGLLFYTTYRYYAKGESTDWQTVAAKETARLENGRPGAIGVIWSFFRNPSSFQTSRKGMPLKKIDYFWMISLTLVYACFALYDLGDRQAPATAFAVEQNQTITFDFGSDVPATLTYYIAPWHKSIFTLEGRNHTNESWTALEDVTLDKVFTWQNVSLKSNMSQLKFTLQSSRSTSLLELAFLDQDGNYLTPLNAEEYPALFDESALIPKTKGFRNSMYFDEIYHARTAYEFLNGLISYENTHPPFGKILISIGVAMFGMNPFGWRIIGTLFGIAMIPLVYLFARRITDSTLMSALACTMFTFDFMHFAQTRIATIDVYITFFVILMYYFMFQYCKLSFYDTPLKKTWIPLGACGISMGLGVASKWTGVYAGIGLALIFFSVLYRRYLEYQAAQKNPSGKTNGISHKQVIKNFVPYVKQTIYFCMVFFVALPALIYLLSYVPFRDYTERGLLDRMIHNQETMFNYHSNLESTHPYSSSWYEWPIMKRPIWYFSNTITKTAEGGIRAGCVKNTHTPPRTTHKPMETGTNSTVQTDDSDSIPAKKLRLSSRTITQTYKTRLREGISSFGNPAVWWPGIPAAFYMVYLFVKKKDRIAAFLLVGYLAQYLPWFFVTRITFIYHYFPSVVFLVLMILYSILQWRAKLPKPLFVTMVLLYGITVLGLFLLFYPVLAGQPVDADFVTKYLRWFDSWVLTSK